MSQKKWRLEIETEVEKMKTQEWSGKKMKADSVENR